MNRGFLTKLLVTLPVSLCLLGTIFSHPSVYAKANILVDENRSFDSLETALKEAPAGATILVQHGHYSGNFVITKPLKLIGVNEPTLDGLGQGSVITIKSSNVTIAGFSIEHSGSDLGNSPSGIQLDSVHDVSILHNTMNDVEYGVFVSASHGCLIDNNQIDGKFHLLPEDRGDGFRLWNSTNIEVTNNHVQNTRDGMEFEFSSHNHVTGNTFELLRYGLHYMYSNYNDFYRNLFTNDVAGAVPMYSSYITFSHNIFTHMLDYRAYGVLLKADHDCTITDNLIFDNTVGMFIDGSNQNIISNNYIANNGIGLRVLGNSWNNTFSKNNLIDNITQVGKISQGLPNNWSFNGQGNFWSDYVGVDPTGSGIGTPAYYSRNYFASQVSQFPILLQFASSPAISALKSANNQLPLAQISGIEDSHPLIRQVPTDSDWNAYLSTKNDEWPYTALFSAICILVGGFILFVTHRPKRRKVV